MPAQDISMPLRNFFLGINAKTLAFLAGLALYSPSFISNGLYELLRVGPPGTRSFWLT